MGGCCSSLHRAGKARSNAIDRQIHEDSKRIKKECKILLLGSGESGKSTILKQMQILHQSGFTQAELADYRPIIYKNVLDSAQAVVTYMQTLGVECLGHKSRVLADKIIDYRLESSLEDLRTAPPSPYFSPNIAETIHQLWKDPVVPKIMDEHSSHFYLMDNAAYFFDEVVRIGTPGYVPNVEDVLRARQKTIGFTETRFRMGTLSIHMFDVGGQRSERKKWIHCFEGVTSIIFCTAISEYDQVLLEERSQNRMTESLVLFEAVVNSRWFMRTSIILFLNKIDVFKTKLHKVPLQRSLPEYTGGADINNAVSYILWRFMEVNKARLSVYPHVTQATDTSNIRLVFADVKETILRNALKDSGIL